MAVRLISESSVPLADAEQWPLRRQSGLADHVAGEEDAAKSGLVGAVVAGVEALLAACPVRIQLGDCVRHLVAPDLEGLAESPLVDGIGEAGRRQDVVLHPRSEVHSLGEGKARRWWRVAHPHNLWPVVTGLVWLPIKHLKMVRLLRQ
jgi:hypothetical protein